MRSPRRPRRLVPLLWVWLVVCAGPASAQTPASARTPAAADGQRTVAGLFADFLHFSLIGRFDLADTYAIELLDRSDLDPVEVLQLSEQHKRSIETLIVLINNSTIGENAARILEVIREGEHLQRKDTSRILANIEKLGGSPQTEYNAIRHLADSGEYAVPWMINTLSDDTKKHLWPRVIRSLPQIGKPAVGPLVMALRVERNMVNRIVIDALGELGYAQAVPYLQAVAIDSGLTSDVRSAAGQAVEQIARRIGRTFDLPPADEYIRLAEQYYSEHGSVQADPRLGEANVWYWDPATQFVSSIPVPREIFGPVMTMRCCEYALTINPDNSDAIALWLAANIRREARLGMNVESADASESGVSDPTRPANFPRAVYFTSASGPRFAHLVLGRAVSDQDAPVALGAIAALQRVAGPSSLIGPEDHKQPLVEALSFPHLLVRSRAALALGNALPQSSFTGADLVVPVLANAVTQTGRRSFLVIDPDGESLNRLMNELRAGDTNVVGETDVYRALERGRTELPSVAGIFLSTAVTNPGPADAIRTIRGQNDLARTPIVLLVKPDHVTLVERFSSGDPGVEDVDAGAANADVLLAHLDDAAARVGQTPLDDDLALELALLATRTLHRIAVDGRTVLNASGAERALTAALGSVHQDLQVAAVDVLALIPTATAQRSIADVALTQDDETLRIAAFGGLAESAKRFGGGLNDSQMRDLMAISFDESNLRLRTAASHALGALNLPANKAGEIVRKYRRG